MEYTPEVLFNKSNDYRYIKDVVSAQSFFVNNYKKNTEHYEKNGYTYAKYLFGGEQDIVDGDYFEYQINPQGFRGKDFNEFNPKNINILFGGCSISVGVGLPESNTWYKKLANKIQDMRQDKKVDFYNISVNGASIELIIKNVIAFIKSGRKIDYIFLLLPEGSRSLSFNDEERTFLKYLFSDPWKPTKKYYSQQYIHEDKVLINFILLSLLEELCKNAEIKLIWTTCNPAEYSLYENSSFNNYFIMDQPPIELVLYPPNSSGKNNRIEFTEKQYSRALKNFEAIYNNKNNEPYWSIARDGLHYGSAANNLIAENFFNKLENTDASI